MEAGWSLKRAVGNAGASPTDVCHRHRHNGTCPNALRQPVSEMNEAVLRAVEEHALTPEAVEHVIQLTERDDVREQQERIVREHKDVERRIKHVQNAVETGGDAVTLVARLRELETRQAELRRELVILQPVPRLPAKVVEDRLTEWRRLLRASTTQGRAVLQRILSGRITFTPRADGDGYDFSAPTRYDKLFAGMIFDVPSLCRDSREEPNTWASKTRPREITVACSNEPTGKLEKG